MEKFSLFSVGVKLFHAQSILGVASMVLPIDKKYDVLRNELFDAALKLSHCLDVLTEIEDVKTVSY